MRCSGGGAWLTIGLSEYVCRPPNDLNHYVHRLREGRERPGEVGERPAYTPLRELMALERLVRTSDEDLAARDRAMDHYAQAALLIESLHRGSYGRDRFQEFVRAAGRVEENDVAAIERVLGVVYELSIEELEAGWIAYCAARPKSGRPARAR